MKYFLLALWLFPALATVAQDQPVAHPDTLAARMSPRQSRYLDVNAHYSFVDSLSLWRYALDTTYRGQERDKVKALGKLYFWRSSPIMLTMTNPQQEEAWTPSISFDIYQDRDLSWCLDEVRGLGLRSSCWAPNVSGNIVQAGQYVLVSRSPCVRCEPFHRDSKDYCHPVIAAAFRAIADRTLTTIQEMAAALPLQAAARPTHIQGYGMD